MTPENTVFVPLDQVNRRPDHDNHPILEDREFAGEALLAKADELIDRDKRLNAEQRELARQKIRELIAVHTMNAPVLLLNMSEDTNDEIMRSGYATPDVWMHGRSRGDWALAMRQSHSDFAGDWITTTMYYNMWTFIGDVRSGTTRLLVGEDAVQEWFQARGLASLYMDDAQTYYLESDINVLQQMNRANMPVAYLNLTEEELVAVGERIAAYAIVDGYRGDHAYGALEYLLNIHTDEQRNKLYTHVAEEIAEVLPVTHADELPVGLFGAVETLADRIRQVEGQPQSKQRRSDARRLLLLAHMYRHRVQITEGDAEPLPPSTREQTADIEGLTLDYKLSVFAKDNPTREEVWQDIDYINHFGTAHSSADYFRMTEARAVRLSVKFHEVIMDNEVPLSDLGAVFDALETVFVSFSPDETSGKRSLYRDMLNALSRNLPTRKYGKGDLVRVIGVLETILPRMPDILRDYRGDYLAGAAEVAAIIADMYQYLYEYLASYYIQADITHTGEDADD